MKKKTMKLTAAEQAWLTRLNEVLAECPSPRLGFFTIGDPSIHVFDKRREQEANTMMEEKHRDFGLCCEELGILSPRSILFPSAVHSTAG